MRTDPSVKTIQPAIINNLYKQIYVFMDKYIQKQSFIRGLLLYLSNPIKA